MPPFVLYLDASPLLLPRTAAKVNLVRFFRRDHEWAVMPFRRLKVRQFYVRLVCALLAGLLPMVLDWPSSSTRQTATGVRQDADGAAATCQADV